MLSNINELIKTHLGLELAPDHLALGGLRLVAQPARELLGDLLGRHDV